MTLQTKHVHWLIRAIVVLIGCNVAYFVCAKLDAPEWATIAISIAGSFVAQIALAEPLFDAYMLWNLRRLARGN